MSALRQCVTLGRRSLRKFSTNHALKSAEEHPAFKKLKANQELFQREDLVEEVFVKKGASDQLVYRAILALTFVGLVLDGKVMYELATGTF